jgi:hypothetical protein
MALGRSASDSRRSGLPSRTLVGNCQMLACTGLRPGSSHRSWFPHTHMFIGVYFRT